MIKKQTVSKGLDSVIYRGSFSTKKPSVVIMSVSHDIALEVSRLFEDKKQNIEREKGLIGVELVLVYSEEEEKKEEPIIISAPLVSHSLEDMLIQDEDDIDTEVEVSL